MLLKIIKNVVLLIMFIQAYTTGISYSTNDKEGMVYNYIAVRRQSMAVAKATHIHG